MHVFRNDAYQLPTHSPLPKPFATVTYMLLLFVAHSSHTSQALSLLFSPEVC